MKHQSDSDVLLYQTDDDTTRHPIHDKDELDTLLR